MPNAAIDDGGESIERGSSGGITLRSDPTDSVMRTLAEESPDAVMVVDAQGLLVWANRQVEQLFGFGQAELLGQHVELLLPLAVREVHLAHRAAFMKSPHTRRMGVGIDLEARRSDGSTFPVEVSLTPLATDRGDSVIATVRDVSERQVIADQQGALRRVATLVAQGALPEEVFAVVSEEVGRLLGVDIAGMARYDPNERATCLAAWTRTGDSSPIAVGGQYEIGDSSLSTLVYRTSQPARLEGYGDEIPWADAARSMGVGSSVATPINVDGRLWGLIAVSSTHADPLPADTEVQLADFTHLLATAIANAQARLELGRFAEEQAALRRVATLVAQGATPEEVFTAVAEEVGRVLGVDFTSMGKYHPDGAETVVGAWTRSGAPAHFPVGTMLPGGGANIHTLVFRTHRPARLDAIVDDVGPALAPALAAGIRASVGVPINVDGQLWGVVISSSTRQEPLPSDTEVRMESFTQLVGTAIANAQARIELRRYAEEQAALRRVATLVVQGVAPEEVFAALTEEVGRALGSDFTGLSRYNGDGTATVLGEWTRTETPPPMPIGERFDLGGENVTTLVAQTGLPARVDDYDRGSGMWADAARVWGFFSCVGVPIIVEDRPWGVVSVANSGTEALPEDTEARLIGFTDMVATAVANAQVRADLRTFADEQGALRRVATLVARGAPPEELFASVAEEVGRALGVDYTAMSRYESDRVRLVVGAWARSGTPVVPVRTSELLGGPNVPSLIFESGRPARVDHYDENAGPAAAAAVAAGVRTSVGVPIRVDDRLWGVMNVYSKDEDPLPADTEERLARFTELIATAIANADAQSALSASRSRIMTTADATRRRIERDLHDGAQQRLVSLALRLRTALAKRSHDAAALGEHLDLAVKEVTGVLDELREIARGIHPAALANGGLGAAFKTLAGRSAVPVHLDVRVDKQLTEDIELCAYYVISEALTNAAKHADASGAFAVVKAEDSVLRIEIRDDGRGGASLANGSGLVGLKDRVEALGGELSLRSPTGVGTTLVIVLPLMLGSRTRVSHAGA